MTNVTNVSTITVSQRRVVECAKLALKWRHEQLERKVEASCQESINAAIAHNKGWWVRKISKKFLPVRPLKDLVDEAYADFESNGHYPESSLWWDFRTTRTEWWHRLEKLADLPDVDVPMQLSIDDATLINYSQHMKAQVSKAE